MIRIHNPRAAGAQLSTLIPFRHIVLVEGSDDASVIEFILRGILDSVLIHVAGGEDNFANVLALLEDLRGFATIGSITMVRDANGNPEGKFRSCKAMLEAHNLPAPSALLLAAGDKPRAGIVLMPPANPGSLESVLLSAYPAADHLGHARAFIDGIDSDDPAAGDWSPGQVDKRLLRALLAVGSKRLKIKVNSIVPKAVELGLWASDDPAFDPYRSYFSTLEAMPTSE